MFGENEDLGGFVPCHSLSDQRLCFPYIDSTIPLLPKAEISSI